jgi:uncharacterized protein (TIGR02996 family)
MNDDAAFLEMIAAEPDELGPRLRYADILDEQATPAAAARAEFIRVQCALDQLPEAGPSFEKLRRREHELLETHWHVWMRPICQALGEPLPVPPVKRTWGEWLRRRRRRSAAEFVPRLELLWTSGPRPNHIIITRVPAWRGLTPPFLSYARFARGFISEVVLIARPTRGPSYLDRLFERTPVTHLALHQFGGPAMRHLAEKGWLRRLRALDLFGPGPGTLAELAAAPDGASLRSLALNSVTGDVGEDLLGAESLRPERLGLHHVNLPDESFETLAEAPIMSRVAHLTLEGFAPRAAVLVHFLERSAVRRLELIGPVGMEAARMMDELLRTRFPLLTVVARGHPHD